MPTETNGLSRASTVRAPLSSDEASQFEALRDALPEGWIVELRPEGGRAWTAFVYCDDAPRSCPMFTVCHLGDGVGWFAEWMNGVASSALTFTKLRPILEQVLSRVIAFTQAPLATVPTDSSVNAQH